MEDTRPNAKEEWEKAENLPMGEAMAHLEYLKNQLAEEDTRYKVLADLASEIVANPYVGFSYGETSAVPIFTSTSKFLSHEALRLVTSHREITGGEHMPHDTFFDCMKNALEKAKTNGLDEYGRLRFDKPCQAEPRQL